MQEESFIQMHIAAAMQNNRKKKYNRNREEQTDKICKQRNKKTFAF